MRAEDFNNFARRWADACEASANGKIVTQGAMIFIFEALQDYTLDDVCRALTMHCRHNKFAPAPSDIVEIISGGSRHYAADEAWAIVLRSFDERETVIMTDEMLAAKSEIQEVFDSGDTIGARMAFRAAYDRIIRTAPAPKWHVSVGYDSQRRADAVINAVNSGLLPRGTEQKYLEHGNRDAGPIVAMLTGNVVDHPSADKAFKRKWGEISKSLVDAMEYAEDRKRAEALERERQRAAFESNRAAQLSEVEKRLIKIEA